MAKRLAMGGFWSHFKNIIYLLVAVFIAIFVLAPPILYFFDPIPTAGFSSEELDTFDNLYRNADYYVMLNVLFDDDDGAMLSGCAILRDNQLYILTAAHLAEPGQHLKKISVTNFNSYGRDWQTARLVGYDRNLDVALLKLDHPEAYRGGVAVLGNASQLREGDKLMVVGLNTSRAVPERSLGAFVANHWWLFYEKEGGHTFKQDSLHIATFIKPGYSGGPIVNGNGELVGIATNTIQGKAPAWMPDWLSQRLGIKDRVIVDGGTDIDSIRAILPELANGLKRD